MYHCMPHKFSSMQTCHASHLPRYCLTGGHIEPWRFLTANHSASHCIEISSTLRRVSLTHFPQIFSNRLDLDSFFSDSSLNDQALDFLIVIAGRSASKV